MGQYSTKFIIGMVLLTTNQVIGWGGAALCAYLAKKTGKKAYLAWGTFIYALSWGMLFLGAYLAGKEGLDLTKKLLSRFGWWTLPAGLIVIAAVILTAKLKKTRAPEAQGR